jgi:hypothetical protein
MGVRAVQGDAPYPNRSTRSVPLSNARPRGTNPRSSATPFGAEGWPASASPPWLSLPSAGSRPLLKSGAGAGKISPARPARCCRWLAGLGHVTESSSTCRASACGSAWRRERRARSTGPASARRGRAARPARPPARSGRPSSASPAAAPNFACARRPRALPVSGVGRRTPVSTTVESIGPPLSGSVPPCTPSRSACRVRPPPCPAEPAGELALEQRDQAEAAPVESETSRQRISQPNPRRCFSCIADTQA